MPIDSKSKILSFIETQGHATSKQLCDYLSISRQALNKHIRDLIDSDKIIKSGSTRATKYYPFKGDSKPVVFKKTLRLENLDESQVYEEVATISNLRFLLTVEQETIVNYAFTEMLNNAIDHSKAEKCDIAISVGATRIEFEIRDTGIGLFDSIASKFSLSDEHTAMIELVKGKTTTMPEAHSGEGIFFSSRAADKFTLRSHHIELCWDRSKDDIFASQSRYLKGTRVKFSLNRSSRTTLESVFAKYAPEEFDYEFSKTKIFIKLLKPQYISRSEAKRLVVNLDKFREVELDFKDVKVLGQGFADEVFRVFSKQHPEVIFKTTNANAAIRAMINHAINTSVSN